jgi:hypothetical protein
MGTKLRNSRGVQGPTRLAPPRDTMRYGMSTATVPGTTIVKKRLLRASILLGLRLRRALSPLPEAVGDRRWEAIAQCPGHQHNLAAVVGFVGHEIA